MSQIVDLLNQTLDPSKTKSVEQSLAQYETQPGFAIELLRLVNNNGLELSTRLAAALSFKNLIRRKWVDSTGQHLLTEQDVAAIKSEILNLMITLPHANLQAQLGEAVSIIADSDFPDRWPDLIPSLVEKIGQDPKVNNGVLVIAHSIFRRWRPLFRTDELFTEIALVLSQFTQPYLQLMVQTNEAIQQASNLETLKDLLGTMSLLVKLFYDLNCQDIPEFFEDHINDFMGILHYYLTYQHAAIEESADDDQASVLEEIRADICEILQLYTQKYEEQFGSFVPTFVQSALSLLVNLGPLPRFDLVVNRALGFLSVVVSLPSYLGLFDKDNELNELIARTIIPNVKLTEYDEELFEDEPIEYIRRDLEGADSDTRRRAATTLLRELATKLESKVTAVVTGFVDHYITQYKQGPETNWRSKNTATYLFSCVATKGVITSRGVSSTNLQVDIVDFFSKNVAPDLVGSKNAGHPILQVDAIKFIHNFRNQLTKQQLSDAMGVLVQLLNSNQYVVYTCSAITIERILSIREGGIVGNGDLMFAKSDIQPVAKSLIDNLMTLILKNASNPTKLSENEFLVKCIMRVLILIQDGSSAFGGELLPTLIKIVEAISANPANPRFSHYLFECVGATIKYNDFSDAKLEEQVIQPLLSFLAQDVTEFIPYTLQILSLILQQRKQPGLPPIYRQLLKPLLTPALWEPRGNVPALVGIIEEILKHGADAVVSETLLTPLLGVFQRLLGSKSNDVYAIEMLEHILTFVPKQTIEPLTKDIAQVLLVRLQNARTDKFLARFSRFIYFMAASNPSQGCLGPEFTIQFFDQVQQGVFGQVFTKFVLPATLKIGGIHDRRTAALGLTSLLFQTPQFVSGAYSSIWPEGAAILVALVQSNTAERMQDLVVDVDLEELSFGNTFSPLSTVSKKPLDPNPKFTDTPTDFFKHSIVKYNGEYSGSLNQIQQLMAKLDEERRGYLQGLGL